MCSKLMPLQWNPSTEYILSDFLHILNIPMCFGPLQFLFNPWVFSHNDRRHWIHFASYSVPVRSAMLEIEIQNIKGNVLST